MTSEECIAEERKKEQQRLYDEKLGCHCRQPHHLPIWWCPVHGEVTVPMD
jgi:hypothetical protein